MTTVAGLPQYVVLKYTATGKYLHYLYNDEDSGVYYTCIGVKRDVDRFNPFVKFEVVPSTINPTHVHLRALVHRQVHRASSQGRHLVALRHGRLPRRGPHQGDLHHLPAHRRERHRRVPARAEG
ncbi:hypothetical protein LINPERPRIM_LOCUS27047 [Linum perenne]